MADWKDRAKAAMALNGVRQEDLLDIFDVTTRGAVGHYFSSRREPSINSLIALARRLGMRVDELLLGERESQLTRQELESIVDAVRILQSQELPISAENLGKALGKMQTSPPPATDAVVALPKKKPKEVAKHVAVGAGSSEVGAVASQGSRTRKASKGRPPAT